MEFTKMHGCGNDYIYFDCTRQPMDRDLASQLAVRLSDRHFGIGGDGIILIEKGQNADFEMVMYNADGSRGAMCGNGIRCVAKYVYDHKLTDKTTVTIASMGAVKTIDIQVQDGVAVGASVDMGAPILDPAAIPVVTDCKPPVDVPITVHDTVYKMTCVSMGNPHAVVFIDRSPREFPLEQVGPLFEHHPCFPDRTNTEFAFVQDRQNIEMRVWERGSGETLACGTGACAAVVAAVANGLCEKGRDITVRVQGGDLVAAILGGYVDHRVTVHLLGGDLQISWSGKAEDSVRMTGPATTVFSGKIDL